MSRYDLTVLEADGPVHFSVKLAPWYMRWFPYDGVTIGHTIYTSRRGHFSARWWAHEYAHVLQWRELGRWGFLKRYLHQMWTRGYNTNELEVLAERYAQAFQHLPHFQFFSSTIA